MLVSIIMPTYNSSATIRQSIDSVICQTYHNWELIISDDCSSDDTVLIVKEYQSRGVNIILLESKKNMGSALARNNALDQAKGRYIAFLDSDDIWICDKLMKQMDFFYESKADAIFSSYQKFDSNKDRGIVQVPIKASYGGLLKTNYIGCLTVIYDTKKIGKIKMPNLRRKQDYALWLEILKIDGIKFYGMQEVLAKYRCEGGNTSNKTRALKEQWFFYREHLDFGLTKSIYYICNYSIFGLLKFLK